MGLLLQLAVAHLLGDFPLQPNKWADGKREPAILARHLAIHAALVACVVTAAGASTRMWLAAAGLLVAHGTIDWFLGGKGKKSTGQLVADQLLHGASILVCFAIMSPLEANFWQQRTIEYLSQAAPLAFVSGLLVSVWVGRYLIGSWIVRFAKEATEESNSVRPGLVDAGARIGMLERLLIFLALVFRMEAMAGFVIGAKAVLRLPEASESKNRALAEYFLLGTLASSAWAVLVALLTRAVIEAW